MLYTREEHKENINGLKYEQKILNQRMRNLNFDMDELNKYKSEDEYYSKKLNESGHDVYSEGKFSLEHKALKKRKIEAGHKIYILGFSMKMIKNELKQEQRKFNEKILNNKNS